MRKQKVKKLLDGKCHFCGESDYAVLQVHRIVPGCAGGKYTEPNMLCVCACCHNRIHAGEIRIDRKYPAAGKRLWVLHYWKGDQEYWQ